MISSLTTQRKITSECDNRGDPNGDRFCDRYEMNRHNVSLPGGASIVYPGSTSRTNRSQAVESALAEKLGRLARTRLATECAKLDPGPGTAPRG